MKINWKYSLPLFLIIIFIGLGYFYIYLNRPNDENVKKEFLEKNPTFEVSSIYIGEGNSDFAEYHIKYKKPNDEKVYEHIVTYWKCVDNKWRMSCKP